MEKEIENLLENYKQAELSKGILIANLKCLREELEDLSAAAAFSAQSIKESGINGTEKERMDQLAKYFTHFCNGVAYGVAAKRIENVLKASGVLDGQNAG